MRPRDPRQEIARRREAAARVRIVPLPDPDPAPDGSVTTRQAADITLPRPELDRVWTPEYLERLARTYWRFITRTSLGLLRVLYGPQSREIALVGRPLVLLRFHAPEYEIGADHGAVTWRIERGLLVAPRGRGRGYLRIAVARPPNPGQGEVTVRVESEVASFYPALVGHGWFARIGLPLYHFTQLRLHVVVTHAFFRSLARLDLEPSLVGILSPGPPVSRAARR